MMTLPIPNCRSPSSSPHQIPTTNARTDPARPDADTDGRPNFTRRPFRPASGWKRPGAVRFGGSLACSSDRAI